MPGALTTNIADLLSNAASVSPDEIWLTTPETDQAFSWQDSLVSKLSGKGSEKLRFELTVSSSLGYGMQSIVIFFLALTQNLSYLPHLVLGVNGFLVALVLLRSRL